MKHAHSSHRQAINLSLDANLVAAAKCHGVNISAVAEKALRQTVREADAAQWITQNREALEAQRKAHEQDGLPSDDVFGWWNAESARRHGPV